MKRSPGCVTGSRSVDKGLQGAGGEEAGPIVADVHQRRRRICVQRGLLGFESVHRHMAATPTLRWPLLSEHLGVDVVVKHENCTWTPPWRSAS